MVFICRERWLLYAVSDQMDLKVLGEVWLQKGSWGVIGCILLHVTSVINSGGSFNASYLVAKQVRKHTRLFCVEDFRIN